MLSRTKYEIRIAMIRLRDAGVVGCAHIWSRQGERYAPACMEERVSFHGGSVLVWACVFYEGHTELDFANETLNDYKVHARNS